MKSDIHIPVLLHQTLEGLNLKPGDVVLDATLGFAGHSREISRLIGETGTIIGLDADKQALTLASDVLQTEPAKFIPILTNFRHLKTELIKIGITEIDACLFDLGLNSFQLDQAGRGFSFRFTEPLYMTLDNDPKAHTLLASDLLNTLAKDDLEIILKNYGEERYASRIATLVVEHRKLKPFKTTTDLVEVVLKAVPKSYQFKRLHPATKTFMALRMAVNDELGSLEEALNDLWLMLKPTGRLAVISFHSLEARVVKRFYLKQKENGSGSFITKPVIKPSLLETKTNPRSRSAQLRIIEKN